MLFYQAAVLTSNAVGALELYLTWRQFSTYGHTVIPKPFRHVVTEEEFADSQKYQKDVCGASIVWRAADLVVANLCFLWKFPAKLYRAVAASAGLSAGSLAHSVAYCVATDMLKMLVTVPLSYYREFVVEESHGFNKMTRWEFAKDQLKCFLLRALLLYPLQATIVVCTVRFFGKEFPLYFSAATTSLVLAFTFIYPAFIQPLFDVFTPLDESSRLYQDIVRLAERVKFPVKRIFIVDGSRRTSHSNAYLYGFWKNKRIAIYDTLVEQTTDDPEQIITVLSHELGHWRHNHTLLTVSLILAPLYVLSYGAKYCIFNPDLYRQFGYDDINPFIGFFLVAEELVSPAIVVYGYGVSWLQRQCEFQADRFAVEMGYAEKLKKTLLLLHKKNKGDLTPDPLYSAAHHSHPNLVERIEAIDTAYALQRQKRE